MLKLDLKKQYKHLYQPSAKEVLLVQVPPLNFVMLGGQIPAGTSVGDSESFHQAMMALYGIAYTLKFASKQQATNPIDFPLMALEAQWWTASGGGFDFTRKEPWCFNAMFMQPDHITPEMFAEAVETLWRKKGAENPAIQGLRYERFEEGLCIQTMHIGPYSTEPATLARMAAFREENGYRTNGRHHEIYLGDPRRAAPEKLRTVLRQPVAKI